MTKRLKVVFMNINWRNFSYNFITRFFLSKLKMTKSCLCCKEIKGVCVKMNWDWDIYARNVINYIIQNNCNNDKASMKSSIVLTSTLYFTLLNAHLAIYVSCVPYIPNIIRTLNWKQCIFLGFGSCGLVLRIQWM